MYRRTSLVFILFTILLILFIGMNKVQKVRANGAIYIRPDGSIDPPTAPINRTENIYTLSDNIFNQSIIVEKDHIEIDGTGHIIEGTEILNSKGIDVTGRRNITIRNTQVVGYYYGIHLKESNENHLIDNTVTSNCYGIILWSSNDTSLIDNIATNNTFGIWFYYSTNNTLSGNAANENTYNFGVYTFDTNYAHFLHNISKDNTVDGRPIYYLKDEVDTTIDLTSNAGTIYLINCNNMRVKDLILERAEIGVFLLNTSSTNVYNVTVQDCIQGMVLRNCGYTMLANNSIMNNGNGIAVQYSRNNRLVDNVISTSPYGEGVSFQHSTNNTFVRNLVAECEGGIGFDSSSNNEIYHNHFVNNLAQHMTYYSINTWDNGYPSGGNYWSHYTGVDLNHDGIGDTPHILDINNTDHHPLTGHFSDFTQYSVQTICNSTISDFMFNGSAISFDVSGEDHTVGFCRISIARTLMNGPYRVFINGTEIQPIPLTDISNSTHAYLYFTYSHSALEVVIIPEFPSIIVLPLLMIAALLTAIFYRRKHQPTFV